MTGVGWSAPAAMRSEGGSFGFQIGASDTDVVLLVMNDGGICEVLSQGALDSIDATNFAKHERESLIMNVT